MFFDCVFGLVVIFLNFPRRDVLKFSQCIESGKTQISNMKKVGFVPAVFLF